MGAIPMPASISLMITRVPYHAEVPKLPEPRRLQPVLEPPKAEPMVPPIPEGSQDEFPVNQQYRRVVDANAPSPMPLVPKAGVGWKNRLKYGALAALESMATRAASIPQVSDVPIDGPETLFGGLGAGIAAATNPQAYEELRYRRDTLPRFIEQEKYKASMRDQALKAQRAEADIWNTQMQGQQHKEAARKTGLDADTVEHKLPYVRQQEQVSLATKQQDLTNKQQEPARIQSIVDKNKADANLTKVLTPERVKAQVLTNELKTFETKAAPEKLKTDIELKKAQTNRANRLSSNVSNPRVDTQAARDKAMIAWREGGEKEAKLKFLQEENKKLTQTNEDYANERDSNKKLRALERRWERAKEKIEKEFIEQKSLDNRTGQRNNGNTLRGADANAILYGTRR